VFLTVYLKIAVVVYSEEICEDSYFLQYPSPLTISKKYCNYVGLQLASITTLNIKVNAYHIDGSVSRNGYGMKNI
jgi:hypothetical protein